MGAHRHGAGGRAEPGRSGRQPWRVQSAVGIELVVHDRGRAGRTGQDHIGLDGVDDYIVEHVVGIGADLQLLGLPEAEIAADGEIHLMVGAGAQ